MRRLNAARSYSFDKVLLYKPNGKPDPYNEWNRLLNDLQDFAGRIVKRTDLPKRVKGRY